MKTEWDWNKFFIKLTSKKLWAAAANFVAMLMIAAGQTENEAAQVTALILAAGGIVALIFAEGWVDASREKGGSE